MTSFVHDVVLFFSTTVGKSRDWPFHDFNSCNPFRFCFRSQMNSKVNVVLSIEVVLSEASYTWYKCTQNITLDYKYKNSVWLFSARSHICHFLHYVCVVGEVFWWEIIGLFWQAILLFHWYTSKVFKSSYGHIWGSIKK